MLGKMSVRNIGFRVNGSTIMRLAKKYQGKKIIRKIFIDENYI